MFGLKQVTLQGVHLIIRVRGRGEGGWEGEDEEGERESGFHLSALNLPSGITQVKSLETVDHPFSELGAPSSLNSSSRKGLKEPLKTSLQVTFPWYQERAGAPGTRYHGWQSDMRPSDRISSTSIF